MPTCAIKVINCLIEGCERKAKTRGLCDPCYQSALTAVKKRKVTWDQLISMGLAKPATKVSTHGAGMFAVALAAKKAALLPKTANGTCGEAEGDGVGIPAQREHDIQSTIMRSVTEGAL